MKHLQNLMRCGFNFLRLLWFTLLAIPATVVLELARRRAERTDKVSYETIIVRRGGRVTLHKYTDFMDGWAGETYIERDLEGNLTGICQTAAYRQCGPGLSHSLYVNGWRVPSNAGLLIQPGDEVIQRAAYDDKTFRIITVAAE